MTSTNVSNQGCLAYLVSKIRKLLSRGSGELTVLPYKLRDDFLSQIEFTFYKALVASVGPQVIICPKVGLSDILFVTRPSENYGYVNRIARKHVDFVLCDSISMKPILAIELDDSSHDRPSRRERDVFVDKALEAANLPILRIRARRSYYSTDLTAQLKPFLEPASVGDKSLASAVEDPSYASAPSSATTQPPECPKCGEPMVVRVASKGKYRGRQFFGCSNFPKCQEILPVDSVIPAANR